MVLILKYDVPMNNNYLYVLLLNSKCEQMFYLIVSNGG